MTSVLARGGPFPIRSSQQHQSAPDISSTRAFSGGGHGGFRQKYPCRLLLSANHRVTSLIRNRPPLGPYSRDMPGPLWWSWGGGRFLMSEVPLYDWWMAHRRRRGGPICPETGPSQAYPETFLTGRLGWSSGFTRCFLEQNFLFLEQKLKLFFGTKFAWQA